MRPHPTSVQSPKNIQFTNILNASVSTTQIPTAATTPNSHSDRSSGATFSPNLPPLPRYKESLFDCRLWNFSHSPVSNELRNARTSHPCERGAGFLKI